MARPQAIRTRAAGLRDGNAYFIVIAGIAVIPCVATTNLVKRYGQLTAALTSALALVEVKLTIETEGL